MYTHYPSATVCCASSLVPSIRALVLTYSTLVLSDNLVIIRFWYKSYWIGDPKIVAGGFMHTSYRYLYDFNYVDICFCGMRCFIQSLRAEREARSEFCGIREKSQYARTDPNRPNPTPSRF